MQQILIHPSSLFAHHPLLQWHPQEQLSPWAAALEIQSSSSKKLPCPQTAPPPPNARSRSRMQQNIITLVLKLRRDLKEHDDDDDDDDDGASTWWWWWWWCTRDDHVAVGMLLSLDEGQGEGCYRSTPHCSCLFSQLLLLLLLQW